MRTDVRKKLATLGRRPYRTIAPISKVLISESIADIMRRHRHPCHCHYIAARISSIPSACMTTKRTIITRCVYHHLPTVGMRWYRHVARCLSFLFLSRFSRMHARTHNRIRVRRNVIQKARVLSNVNCILTTN